MVKVKTDSNNSEDCTLGFTLEEFLAWIEDNYTNIDEDYWAPISGGECISREELSERFIQERFIQTLSGCPFDEQLK